MKGFEGHPSVAGVPLAASVGLHPPVTKVL